MNRYEAILWTEKLASGQYDQQELNIFLEYLQNANKEEVEEILSVYHKKLSDQPSYPLQVSTGFMDQLKMLRSEAEEGIPLSGHSAKIIPAWLKLTAAAVLILSLSISFYLFTNGSKRSLDIVASEKDTTWIMPEHNKAMLTLADGSIIALDAVTDGNISEQHGVKVIKIDSALLSYKNNNNHQSQPHAPAFNTITVPVGGQYQLILADGSHVWLNSASSLTFPVAFIEEKHRKVALKGEAYFEIAKDASKPFIVGTGNMQVEVLGTHFNVTAYPDEEDIKTTLLEGSVKLSSNNDQTLIRPGEQGILLHGSTAPFKVGKANIDEVIAWKEGRFRFDEMNIRPIMRQISRWYDVAVVYEGDLSGISLSGSVPRKEKVTQLLRALEMSERVKFEMKGNQILVKPFVNQN
ncbi:MAG: FecR domain-containing protein [Chitinophagaceae bacterium]|nr:FecR domain-containing protein [Chitinophagaceae bacterium]